MFTLASVSSLVTTTQDLRFQVAFELTINSDGIFSIYVEMRIYMTALFALDEFA